MQIKEKISQTHKFWKKTPVGLGFFEKKKKNIESNQIEPIVPTVIVCHIPHNQTLLECQKKKKE